MDLNRDAMLAGLRITAWSGRLYDREASDHVAAHHDASASTGRYNKRLLPKAAFAALTATMSEARTKHYENSLPWDDKGGRLLTVANYEHYTGLMKGLSERVVRQRARFIEDYDDYVDRARLDLGKLFRIEDYPSKEALQGKFAIRYRITPVPDAEHFIAKLASDDTDRVKRDIERHIEEQLHDAVGDLYRRLGEAVERVSDRLQEDENGKPLVFRNSMIENIRDLVDVVPRLNIFGDDGLARLCGHRPAVLDNTVRRAPTTLPVMMVMLPIPATPMLTVILTVMLMQVPIMDTESGIHTMRLGASLRDRATLPSPLRGLGPSGGYPSRLRSLRSLRAPVPFLATSRFNSSELGRPPGATPARSVPSAPQADRCPGGSATTDAR